MSALHRKLLRDLAATFGTILTVVLIIGIGAATFVGLRSAQRILEASQTAYYRDYRFADFWIDVKKAPLSAAERVAQLPGIADLQPRVVFDVIVDIEGEPRPISARLISTHPRRFAESINGLHLVRGSGFSDNRDEEIIISESFARAHGLEIGDTLRLILNRRRQSFLIVGTAISPEYVYMVRGPGDLIPDARHFGILYIKERYARQVLDFEDACNQIVGRVNVTGEARLDALLEQAEHILDPFGVLDVTPRRRQASHRFLSDEIAGLGVSATIMPAIFLAVAALVLNILMVRLVQRQRTIVGTLKALGWPNRAIVFHYLSYGMLTGALGGILGALIGSLLLYFMLSLYRSFFQFPRLEYAIQWDLLAFGLLISIAFAAAGAIHGVRQVLALAPAEAMRQRAPQRGGRVFLERFPRLWRALGFRMHLALRTIFRDRFRTATGVISAALSTGIIFLALVIYDSFLSMVDYQFGAVVRSDVDIALRDERSRSALYEADRLPGVDYAEPVLAVVCDLRRGPRARRVGITGLSPDHRLTVPRDAAGQPIELPVEGLAMSRKLAQLLDAGLGDAIELTPVRGRRRTRSARIASIVDSQIGLDCYADIRYLARLVGESSAVGQVQLAVNPARQRDLYNAIKELPNAQGLSVRADSRRILEDTLIKTSSISIGLLVLFAGFLAFGTSLSGALFEIGDRVRELATLRVLGYQPREVSGILVRQSIITFIPGLLLAFPIGYVMLQLVANAYDTELYRLRLVIRPLVVGLTAGLALCFALAAMAVVHRGVVRLDWAEGVKVKE